MEALKRIIQHFKRLPRAEWVIFLFALGLWVLYDLYENWRQPEPLLALPRYLVTTRAVPQGLPVSLSDLTFRHARDRKQGIPPQTYTDQDLSTLKGAHFIRALPAGAPITPDTVLLSAEKTGLGNRLPRGKRAYALTPLNPLPVRPGDHVDLYSSAAGARSAVVDNVAVLHAAYRHDRFEIILAVTPLQIEVLERAQQQGKLTVAVVSQHEEMSESRAIRRVRNPKSTPRPRIEIWYD